MKFGICGADNVGSIPLTQMRKPHCYFLVGLPGSGKSTWAEQRFLMPIVSSDKWVERLAEQLGKTYNEAFADVIKEATLLFNKEIDALIEARRDFVWDQTNLNVKTRAGKLSRIKGYDIIATVFEIESEELERRRAGRPEKTIPAHILKSMADTYQVPTVDEGFMKVTFVRD